MKTFLMFVMGLLVGVATMVYPLMQAKHNTNDMMRAYDNLWQYWNTNPHPVECKHRGY